jgi:K+-sensing histidine kinase KdpD
LALVSANPAVILRVTDNGPGIPEDERDCVVDRFNHLVGRAEAFNGQGLSIVKRNADLHRATPRPLPKPGGQGLADEASLPAIEP